MSSPLYVIGIDQSFTSTGFVVLNNEDQSVVFSARICSDPKSDIFDRVVQITTEVVNLINTWPNAPIILEGLAFGNVGNATRDLAGLQFHLVIKLRELKREVTIYTPLTVKKTAELPKGSKRGKKEMMEALPPDVMALFLSNGFKKTKGLPDITDAYWIARTHINKIKTDEQTVNVTQS